MQDLHWQIPPNPTITLMLAKRQLSEFVCDAVNLEGINMTLHTSTTFTTKPFTSS